MFIKLKELQLYGKYKINPDFYVFLFRIQKELAEITLDPPPNCR